MSTQIHGHEVMEMMIASNKSYTKDSLLAAIIEKFGEKARFYTCSDENMTASELIDFLGARGKFLDDESGFKTDPEKICNH